jgi:hypothetical protein
MTPPACARTDLVTASRVDLVLILLPIISWLEATCSLAASGVPAEVAARVLALPEARRAPTCQIGQVDGLAPPAE